MEKIKFIIGFFIGIGIALAFSNEFISKIETKKLQEEIVITNCRDAYILDSIDFANAADSVIRYGNINSYLTLLFHYGSVTNGKNDFLYYTLIMANKYSYPDASYNISWIIGDSINHHNLLFSNIKKYYLTNGAKLGNLSSCFQLKKYYEKGILFEKNLNKAKFYEDKIKKIKETKWIK